MIRRIINEFRAANGRHPFSFPDHEANKHCLWHCQYMSYKEDVVHAPSHYLNGKSEACAMRGFYKDQYNTIRDMIFDDLGKSERHRDIILYSQELACAFYTTQYNIYVTIRGW